jgi:2-keto-3-deoxy-L-rhamnonate aldolase RhmA
MNSPYADDAKAAVRISKYPPQGCRSVSGQQPVLGMKTVSMDQTIKVCNESCSSVIAMIESKDAIEVIDEIAAVDGVDVLLVGSADLSVDLGAPGQLQSDAYRSAVERVSRACHKHGKILGVAGVYDNAEIRDWAINTLGARFMMVQQDAAILSSGAAKGIESLPMAKA